MKRNSLRWSKVTEKDGKYEVRGTKYEVLKAGKVVMKSGKHKAVLITNNYW